MARFKITWAHEARMDLYTILDYYYKRNGNVTFSGKLNSRVFQTTVQDMWFIQIPGVVPALLRIVQFRRGGSPPPLNPHSLKRHTGIR